MNNKNSIANDIIDAVVDCCVTIMPDGRPNFSRGDVLGDSRAENVVMTRQILAMQLQRAGYTFSTIAQLLNRTIRSAHNLVINGYESMIVSKAFCKAHTEATAKCDKITAEIMSYEDKFRMEYNHVRNYMESIRQFCMDWDEGKTELKPRCSREIYNDHIVALLNLLKVLEIRAKAEGIDLGEF